MILVQTTFYHNPLLYQDQKKGSAFLLGFLCIKPRPPLGPADAILLQWPVYSTAVHLVHLGAARGAFEWKGSPKTREKKDQTRSWWMELDHIIAPGFMNQYTLEISAFLGVSFFRAHALAWRGCLELGKEGLSSPAALRSPQEQRPLLSEQPERSELMNLPATVGAEANRGSNP